MTFLNTFQVKRISLFCLLLIGLSFSANASHYSGGELTYTYAGPNQYLVKLTIYRDCNGVSVGSTQVVNYTSAACGVNASITLNLVSTTEVTPLCPSAPSACGGGGNLGIQLIIFQGTLNLPPGCSDWVLSTQNCCRNAAITNLSSPSSQDIYIEARLNNTAGLMDNSPTFSSPPQFFGCVGQTINFQQLAYDSDGDVLVYSLINAKQAASTNVNYAGGFSGVNPFTVPLVLNSSTGQITFTPNVPQVAVVAVLIQEYRNGVLIGSIMRDIQFVIRPCNNGLPAVSGINNVPGVYDVTICSGASTCFNIFGTDPDAGQAISLSYAGGIPGAIFTQTGTTAAPSGTFCWNSSTNPPGDYTFSITAQDDACPLIGQNTILFTVHVVPNPNPAVNAGPDVSICAGDIVTLNATTSAGPGIISGYNWAPPNGLSSPNTASTNSAPSTTTNYTVTLTYTDGCTSQDAVTVSILADPSANVFPTAADVCAGAGFVLTGTSNQPGMSFEWFDPSMVSLGPGVISGSQSSINVSVPPAAGTYQYTLVVTNPLSGCSSSSVSNLTIGTPPALPSCVNIYVSTTGTVAAAGTQADPTTLEEGLARAACNDAIIKMATGTYTINNPLTIGSFVTLEGGFQQGSAWTKISTPGATTINRSTANPEGTVGQQRLVAFYSNGSAGWRLQDVTISTSNANLGGESTYALHLNGCSNYNIVRTQLLPGNAGAGSTGLAGLAGVNGSTGIQGSSGSCDGGSCTFGSGDPGAAGGTGGAGGGGAVGGAGGAAANGVQNNGTVGNPAIGRNGGSGAGGGAGGDECSTNNGGNGASGGNSACVAGGIGGTRGNQGDPGGDGTNGAAGVIGTVGVSGTTGPVGSFVGGFWVPGTSGGNGADGCGGSGGGSGGGGGRQTCTFCDNGPGNGGSGGGGGGQGGTGGTGGSGGGSSYGLVMLNNGANAVIDQSNFVAGAPGALGLGGPGGSGGAGGAGAPRRTTCTSEIGEGGAGGAAGAGGAGGNGGNGTPGVAINYLLVSGTPPVIANYTFNLAAQAVITATNVNCMDTPVNFVTPAAVTWNFTASGTPQSPTGVSVITQFGAVNRYTIGAGANTYVGFHNIAFSNIDAVITTTAQSIGVDTFMVCQGDFASFESLYYADIYSWNFNGAIPPPGNVQVVSSQFNTPGFYPISMNMTTDCCGLSANDFAYLYVVPVSAATGSGNAAICAGEATVLSLAGVLPSDSIVWSPSSNSVPVALGSINVNPTVTTTYTASIYSSVTGGGQTIVGCPTSISFTVTVNPLPVLTMSSTAVLCSNDGTASATVSNPGAFNFVWDTGATTNGATSSTISWLSVNNYAVTVSDVLSGCSVSDSIDVYPSASAPIVYVQTLVGTCENQSTGAVTVATSGGTAPFAYSWSDIGVGTATRIGLATGLYTVTVTDALGCSSSLTFDIPEYETPDATIFANGPICSGDSAYFTLVGTDASTLTYNFGGANSTIFFSSDTMYISVLNVNADLTLYMVSIDNGSCVAILGTSVTVTVLPIPTAVITTNSPVCSGYDAIFTFTGTPDVVVTYTLNGGPLTSITLVGGTVDVTVLGATLDQTIVLDSINDGSCAQYSGAAETITVNPNSATTEDLQVCENQDYTYPDGVTETIVSSTSHLSNLTTAAGCDSIITTNIVMNSAFNQTEDLDVCENDDYTYPDGVVETILASTSHTSNLLTSNGCDSVIVTNITMLPTYSSTEAFTICEGDAHTFPDGTVHDPILANESYTSVFTSVNGCDSLFITNITVNPLPFVSAGVNQTLCEGTSLILSATNPSGAAIAWDNGVVDGVSFTPPTTNTYTVTATSAQGCSTADDVTITVNLNPVVAFSVDELDGCEPLSVVFTNLSSGSVLCEWNFGDDETGTGCGSIDHIYANAGLYAVSLTVTNANGCSTTATYVDYINVYEQPIAAFSFGNGYDVLNQVVHFDNTSVNATSYEWNFGDFSALSSATDPVHNFPSLGSGNYVVTLIAMNGVCFDTVQHIVKIEDVLIYYIPNTFTPDGNSVNQTFQPVFSSGFDPYDFEMLIFNRWGEIIFESYDVNIGWDGTYNGVMVQDGTYTWKVEFKELMSDKRHIDTGHVNLIR